MEELNYFYLSKITDLWDISEADLLQLGSEGKLTLHYVPKRMAMTIKVGERWVGEGMHGYHMDTLNTGNIRDIINCGETVIDAVYLVGPKKFKTTEYSPRSKELGPLIIRHTDLVITKEERDRFERKNGLLSGVIRKNDAALVPTGDNLNHDPELQELANQIANSYFVEHGEHPTKTDVAQIIVGKSYTHLKPDTVVRRIRNNWKN